MSSGVERPILRRPTTFIVVCFAGLIVVVAFSGNLCRPLGLNCWDPLALGFTPRATLCRPPGLGPGGRPGPGVHTPGYHMSPFGLEIRAVTRAWTSIFRTLIGAAGDRLRPTVSSSVPCS